MAIRKRTIKFSHVYQKLLYHNQVIRRARLVEVLNVKLEQLSGPFIDYDTDDGMFKLPEKGQYLLLMFVAQGNYLFTTIRRWTPPKEAYYRKCINDVFEIEVPEDNET
jgi:hypothetical protein